MDRTRWVFILLTGLILGLWTGIEIGRRVVMREALATNNAHIIYDKDKAKIFVWGQKP